MAQHMFGTGTVTLAIVNPERTRIVRRILINGQEDVYRLPIYRAITSNGTVDEPIIGPLMFRELTNRELAEKGVDPRIKESDPMKCLVPIKVYR